MTTRSTKFAVIFDARSSAESVVGQPCGPPHGLRTDRPVRRGRDGHDGDQAGARSGRYLCAPAGLSITLRDQRHGVPVRTMSAARLPCEAAAGARAGGGTGSAIGVR